MSKRHTKSEKAEKQDEHKQDEHKQESHAKSVEYFNYFAKPLARINLGSGFLVTLSGHNGRDESGNLVSLNDDGSQRIRQAYQNLKTTIDSTGASLQNVFRLYAIASGPVYRNIINRIQGEFYDSPPPRTLIFANLPDDDIFEISADIYISHAEIKEIKEKIKETKSIKAQAKHNRRKIPEPEYSEDSVNTADDYESNEDDEDDDEHESDCDCGEHHEEPQIKIPEHKTKESKHLPQKHRPTDKSPQQTGPRSESTRNRHAAQEKVVQAIPIKTKHNKRT